MNGAALFDCHTHRLSAPAGEALVNLPDTVLDAPCGPLPSAGLFSAGIHPWHLAGEATLGRRLDGLRALVEGGRLAAVGECGLDRLAAAPAPLQEAAFEAQVALAEAHDLPVVVHCVRAWDELLRLRRRHPSGRWVVHGFRGGGEQARSLLGAGLSLGFGIRATDAALLACPPEHLFPETDEAPPDSLPVLYGRIAALKGVEAEWLAAQAREAFLQMRH